MPCRVGAEQRGFANVPLPPTQRPLAWRDGASGVSSDGTRGPTQPAIAVPLRRREAAAPSAVSSTLQRPAPRSRLRVHHAGVLVLLLAMLLGASALSFLCDDAFIAFRYVRNAHDGLGLVWNPPPFQPVEGYTGFLWALLLWAVWSVFGIEPPDAANGLSLLCGVGQFAFVAMAALQLRRRDGSVLPPFVGLLAIAVVVGNRTFLQWLSSGLETALFHFAFVAWALLGCRPAEGRTTGWLAGWSLAAAAAALTRPDGLLLVAVTFVAAALEAWRRRTGFRALLLGLAPLLTVFAHVLWRRSFYGEWLPNTYYAKVTGAWPDAGLRYFACFALENGAWLWFPLLAVWLVVELARGGRLVFAPLLDRLPGLAVVGAVAFHTGYYLLVVGGDHFEYRVLSHLVPLGTLAAVAMAARLGNGVALPMLTALALGLAGSVGWVHFALTRQLPLHGFQAIAPQLPAAVQPLARWYDRQQLWLSLRLIGQRCNHHANLLQFFGQATPPGLRFEPGTDAFPVSVHAAVGLAGWALPQCAILDTHGLNDWVLARWPIERAPAVPAQRWLEAASTADTDRDGQLTLDELRTTVATVAGTPPGDRSGDVLLAGVLATHAVERADAVPVAMAAAIGDLLDLRRSMAHERRPPAGYFEAFAPNVVVAGGVAKAMPRAEPLTAERIRAIEAEWRQQVVEQRARR